MRVQWLLLFLLLTAVYLHYEVTPANLQQPGGGIASYHWHWPSFWQTYRSYARWRLQYYDGSGWKTGYGHLTASFDKTFENETHSIMKTTLNFTSGPTGSYRLIVAINQPVLKYINRTDQCEFKLSYEDFELIFNWQDAADIPGLIFSKGFEGGCFWFMIRHDNVPANYNWVIDPTEVATSTARACLATFPKRSTFMATARPNGDRPIFVFYSNGSDLCYKSSTDDGATWSNEYVARSTVSRMGGDVSIRYFPQYHENYTYYAYGKQIVGVGLVFCRGNITYDGGAYNITWGTEYTVAAYSLVVHTFFPSIAIADNGYAYIGCCRGASSNHRWVIYYTTINDGSGSWFLNIGFSNNPSYEATHHYGHNVRFNHHAHIYSSWYYAVDIRGREGNSSVWQTIENITSVSSDRFYSQTCNGTDVYLGFRDASASPNPKAYCRRNSTGSWLPKENITIADTDAGICMATNQTDNYVYAFYWSSQFTTAHPVYTPRNLTAWEPQEDLVSSSPNFYRLSLSSWSWANNSLIGVVWSNGTILATQYIQFEVLDLAPPPIVRIWHNIATWTFNLTTRAWASVSMWTFNLTTMAWQDVALWTFNLTTMQWVQIAFWTFNLITLGWHTIAFWTFSFIVSSPALYMLIAIVISLILLSSAMVYLRRK